MITVVEYDAAGEIFHLAEIDTTEGHMPPPAASASDDEKAAHAQAVADAIAARENATRDELAAHAAGGAPLIVLPAGAATPELGCRSRVDLTSKPPKIVRRTDAQLKAWQAHAAAGGASS